MGKNFANKIANKNPIIPVERPPIKKYPMFIHAKVDQISLKMPRLSNKKESGKKKKNQVKNLLFSKLPKLFPRLPKPKKRKIEPNKKIGLL